MFIFLYLMYERCTKNHEVLGNKWEKIISKLRRTRVETFNDVNELGPLDVNSLRLEFFDSVKGFVTLDRHTNQVSVAENVDPTIVVIVLLEARNLDDFGV
jgi:hypothetical protein